MAKHNEKVVNFTGWRRETKSEILERMFKEHGGALRSFLRARIGSGVDIDDVVQEVFLRLAKMDDLFDSLSPCSGSNRSFILTAANNMVVDMERRKAVRKKYNADHSDQEKQRVTEITPEKIAEESEQLEMINRVIMDMRPNWRRVLILNRLENKSYRQLAGEMGVSVKQIEKYMSRALATIRDAVRQMREMDQSFSRDDNFSRDKNREEPR